MELKHWAAYLPYGVKAQILGYKNDYVGIPVDTIVGVRQWSKKGDWSLETLGGARPALCGAKPILRSLSQLTETELAEFFGKNETFKVEKISEIGENHVTWHFNWVDENPDLNIESTGRSHSGATISLNDEITLKQWQWLHSKRIDCYNLIKSGQAISVETLKTNCYE